MKRLRRELDEARMKSAAGRVSSAAAEAVEVSGVKVLAQRVDALDRGQVRTLVDNLRGKLGSGVVVLGGVQEDGKVALIVGVTKDLTSRVQAGKSSRNWRKWSAAPAGDGRTWPRRAARMPANWIRPCAAHPRLSVVSWHKPVAR